MCESSFLLAKYYLSGRNHRVDWLYWRKPKYNRMVPSFSIPLSNNGIKILDFPALEELENSESELAQKGEFEKQIKEWNERLKVLEEAKGSERNLKVVAGGFVESVLSPRGGLGLW